MSFVSNLYFKLSVLINHAARAEYNNPVCHSLDESNTVLRILSFSGVGTIFVESPTAFITIAKASALVIVSLGRAFVLLRVMIPLSAASSIALHFQSFVVVSEKYFLQE